MLAARETTSSPSVVKTSLLFALAVVQTGCADPHSTHDADGEVTWHEHIAPLVERACLECHQVDGVATLRLDTWEAAHSVAPWMAAEVIAGDMPPWGVEETEACSSPGSWRGDLRLAEAERELFVAWAEGGAPEGSPFSTTSGDALRGTAEGDLLAPDAAWSLAASGPDTFRCLVLDPGLVEDGWIRGLEVLPDARSALHHVLVLSAPESVADLLDTLAAEGGGTFDCAPSSPAFPELQTLTQWAPGASSFELPGDTGLVMPAGSRFVLQLHYHPTGEAVEDATALRVRWHDAPPEREGTVRLLGNAVVAPQLQPGPSDPAEGPVFLVPAGVSDHLETMVLGPFSFPDDGVRIFGVAPHMHYAGAGQRISILGGGGEERCLAEVPRYDFEWQRWYAWEPSSGLPSMASGESLVLRCRYDNTLANESLRRGLAAAGLDEPFDMTLGPTSLHEMCVALVGMSRLRAP